MNFYKALENKIKRSAKICKNAAVKILKPASNISSDLRLVYTKSTELFNVKDEVQDLYMGLAYGQYGINPELLTRSSYNLCLPSMDFYTSYKTYCHFADMLPNLQNIYVVASYYSPGFNLSESGAKNRLEAYEAFLGAKNPNTPLNHITKKGKYNFSKLEIPDNIKRGFETTETEHINTDNKAAVQRHIKHAQKHGTGELKWLLKLKRVCEMNCCKLNVIILPLSKNYRDEMRNKHKLPIRKALMPLANYCITNDIRILNFSPMEISEDNFLDWDHLNNKGAAVFTKELDEYLMSQEK